MSSFLKIDMSAYSPDEIRSIRETLRAGIDYAKDYARQALAEGKSPAEVFADLADGQPETGPNVMLTGDPQCADRLTHMMVVIAIEEVMEERQGSID
jgi:hypothetical protein